MQEIAREGGIELIDSNFEGESMDKVFIKMVNFLKHGTNEKFCHGPPIYHVIGHSPVSPIAKIFLYLSD